MDLIGCWEFFCCCSSLLGLFISPSLASSLHRVKDKVGGKINTSRVCFITCPFYAKPKLDHEISSYFNKGSLLTISCMNETGRCFLIVLTSSTKLSSTFVSTVRRCPHAVSRASKRVCMWKSIGVLMRVEGVGFRGWRWWGAWSCRSRASSALPAGH